MSPLPPPSRKFDSASNGLVGVEFRDFSWKSQEIAHFDGFRKQNRPITKIMKMGDLFYESDEIQKIFLKLLELPRHSFFGPSGGKSDALNPFLMVPTTSFDFCSNWLNCLGALFSDPLGVNQSP